MGATDSCATFKARKLRIKMGRWALHSYHAYTSPVCFWYLLQVNLCSDESDDFTLKGLLEKNMLQPIRMLYVPEILFVEPAIDVHHRIYEPMVLCIALCIYSTYSWPLWKRDQVYISLIGEATDHTGLVSAYFGVFQLVYLTFVFEYHTLLMQLCHRI
jgi:hypothetical protein